MYKNSPENTVITTWESKEVHGRFPVNLKNGDIDKRASYTWLNRGGSFSLIYVGDSSPGSSHKELQET